jgi:hypothetical protein
MHAAVAPGKKRERLDVLRTDGGEMPAVGGEDGRDRSAFGDGDDAGVGAAEREVVVLLDELGHALEVVLDEVGDREVAGGEGSEEGGFGG